MSSICISGCPGSSAPGSSLVFSPITPSPDRQRTPVIVGGDFNDVWGRLGRRFFEPAGFPVPHRPARTFPAWAPVLALDAVYVRGNLRVQHLFRSHLREARFASDHLPLYTELEFI